MKARTRLSRSQARKEFRQMTLIHPELREFIKDPARFSPAIDRIADSEVIANTLHVTEGAKYPNDRPKYITCDARLFELLRVGYGHEVPAFLGATGPRRQLAFVPQEVNAGIVVAGGTAPGTNAVIHWIVKRHTLSYGLTTGHLYGFIGGFRGLGRKGEVNVRPLHLEETQDWVNQPGCALGMSRHREDIGSMVKTLKDLGINILYVIGGDGTLEAAYRLSQEIKRQNLRIVIAAIPKTIDNDIVWCWKTFGFETAIDEATRQIKGFHENVRTHGRIGLVILYGGLAGFLAANAGLSSGVADAVLIPEERQNLSSLFAYTQRCLAREATTLEDHTLFVLAEGIGWKPPFWPLVVEEVCRLKGTRRQKIEMPETGPNEEMREAFTRSLYCLFQRQFAGSRHSPVIVEPRSLVSSTAPSARDIRYCQRLAYNAVDNALAGYTAFMSSYWLTEYVLVPLRIVAGRQRNVPLGGSFWTNVRVSTGQPVW